MSCTRLVAGSRVAGRAGTLAQCVGQCRVAVYGAHIAPQGMLPRVLTIGVQILRGLLPVIETAGSGVQCAGQGEPSSVFLC